MEALNDSAAPHRTHHVLKSKLFILWTACIALFVLLICANPFSKQHHRPSVGSHFEENEAAVPRTIWQTPNTQALDNESRRLSRTWTTLNPHHRHELLPSESAVEFIEEKYRHRHDIVETYQRMNDTALRASLLPYLVLLAEGGVYASIDTHCSRPIDDWIPKEYIAHTNLIVGIEYDGQESDSNGDSLLPVQLCHWAFAAKAGADALQHIVGFLIGAVDDWDQSTESGEPSSRVLDRAGPRLFTKAVLEYLSFRTRRIVSYTDISSLTEPTLIEDVLILPISAFGTGQQSNTSGDQQLMPDPRFAFRGLLPAYE